MTIPVSNNNAVSRPFVVRPVSLNTHNAQQVFKRVFDALAFPLYQALVVLPIITDANKARAVEGLIRTEFDKIKKELNDERAHVEHLMEANGVSEKGEWSMPRVVEANVTSPLAGEFLQYIVTVDQIVDGIALLWVTGVFNTDQYRNGGYRLQRLLIRFAGRVRMLCLQAMAAARRAQQTDSAVETEVKQALESGAAAHVQADEGVFEEGDQQIDKQMATSIDDVLGQRPPEEPAAAPAKGPKDPNKGRTMSENGEVLAYSANASVPVPPKSKRASAAG
ncbi:MAG: hypothetical protein E6Q76_07410 [Rhizobium sp.]|nr:MAG: hypothetical protein E6Q76_07410 [Rhizobium sp.]